MTASRENTPLVEIIAEVKWWPLGVPMTPPLPSSSVGGQIATQMSSSQGFFARLSVAMANLGYTQSERQVPPGFPAPLHQAVLRYRNPVSDGSSLYQVGSGVFTANATPPYKSWEDFEPVVRQGVMAMIGARSEDEAKQSFMAISLRYIDSFGASLTEGRDFSRFLSEVLRIEVSVPNALSRYLCEGALPKSTVQIRIPMDKGRVMSMAVGEGVANGAAGIIMDTSVTTTVPVVATVDAVMESLNDSHDVIRASFFDLIEPIIHLMPLKPVEKS